MTLVEEIEKIVLGSPKPLSAKQLWDLFPNEDEYDVRAAICEAMYEHRIFCNSQRKFVTPRLARPLNT